MVAEKTASFLRGYFFCRTLYAIQCADMFLSVMLSLQGQNFVLGFEHLSSACPQTFYFSLVKMCAIGNPLPGSHFSGIHGPGFPAMCLYNREWPMNGRSDSGCSSMLFMVKTRKHKIVTATPVLSTCR